jgi:hypothetical protein
MARLKRMACCIVSFQRIFWLPRIAPCRKAHLIQRTVQIYAVKKRQAWHLVGRIISPREMILQSGQRRPCPAFCLSPGQRRPCRRLTAGRAFVLAWAGSAVSVVTPRLGIQGEVAWQGGVGVRCRVGCAFGFAAAGDGGAAHHGPGAGQVRRDGRDHPGAAGRRALRPHGRLPLHQGGHHEDIPRVRPPGHARALRPANLALSFQPL